jgi:two-component system, NtrC family, nitrogen regulation sensor histidine kinase NtrY
LSLLKFAGTYRNLSKIQSISRQEVQVSDLFDHVQQLMLPTCQQRQVELDVVLHTPLLSIYADEALIQHVLINLILNALDALKDLPNGHIQLVAELKQHKPLIKVSDNGCGIPSEVLESIFVPFFSTKKNGTGIGLSLCKQIMLLHKAQMTVKSKPNEGTVFTLQFDNT